MRSILVLLLFTLCSNDFVVAQPGIRAIKAGKLLDVTSGTIQSNQVILIEGNTIKDIGTGLVIPPGATVYDLSNYAVLPGLIDCHTHILSAGSDYEKDLYGNSSTFRSLRAAQHLSIALQNGFTTMRDVCSEGTGFSDVDISRAVDSGYIPGPTILPSGKGIAATGRYLPFQEMQNWQIDLPSGAQYVSGTDECIKAVREQTSRGVKWIKLFADFGPYATFSQAEITAVVEEAKKFNIPVAAHATSADGIRMAILAGVKSIEHGDAMNDSLIQLAAANNVFWCPTVSAGEYHGFADEARYAIIKKAVQAKVQVVCGTDVGSFPWNVNQVKELEYYVTKAGLTPAEAIRTATLNAAFLLGKKNIGEIKKGMQADIIAVPGDPLKDIRVLESVVFVMKSGNVCKHQNGK